MKYLIEIGVSPEVTDMGPASMQLLGSVEADTTAEAYVEAGKVLAYQMGVHGMQDQANAIIRIRVSPDPDGKFAEKEGLTKELMGGLDDAIVEHVHLDTDETEELKDEDLYDFWMGMDELMRSGESDEPGDYEDGK